MRTIDRESYTFDERNTDLYFVECGYERCLPGHTFGPAKRKYFLIHFIVKGKGVFYSKRGNYELSENQAFVIFPGDENTYSADESDPWFYYWVGFNGERAAQLLRECDLTRESPIIDRQNDNLMQRYIKSLFHMSKCANFNMYTLTGYLYLFLSCIKKSKSAALSPADRYVEAAKQYIRDNYTLDLTVEGLAGHLHLDRSYLYRLFTASTGVSPQKYITRYKLNAASELLKYSSHSVSQIAMYLGFASDSAFGRAFKNEYGISPHKYKKS